MNRQQVYDKVRDHLLAQGKLSGTESRCLYRGPDGLQCAIGCLIPDDKYSPDLEGKGASNKVVMKALEDIIDDEVTPFFLDCLQSIHDSHEPTCWGDSLAFVAKQNGLRP